MIPKMALPQDRQSVLSAVRDGSWVAPSLRSADGMAWLDRELRPIDGLTTAGLNWLIPYVAPLQGVIDRMMGSASVVHTFADSWEKIGTTLDQAGERLGQVSARETSSWHGESADRYRTWASRTAGTVTEGASLAMATCEAARMMGDAAGNARRIVNDLVTHLVENLVSGVPQAIAAEGGVTAAVVSQATSLVESYRVPVAEVERSLLETMNNLRPHLVSGGGDAGVGGIDREDPGLILAGAAGMFKQRKRWGGGQNQPDGGDAESWWQKLLPWRKPDKKPDGRPARSGRDPHDDLSTQEREELRNKLMSEYRKKDAEKWFSQTNAEDALKGGPPGSKIDVPGPGGDEKKPDVRWLNPDGTVVAGREIKVLERDNMNTLNARLSDAKEQLAEVKGSKEVWIQVPPDSGVSADKLPKMMSEWRNRPWGRTPEQWRDYDGIDVTFRDPTGKVLGRFDTGTGLPKPQ